MAVIQTLTQSSKKKLKVFNLSSSRCQSKIGQSDFIVTFGMMPSRKERKFLTLSYNYFIDIYEEVFTEEFWRTDEYYRFCRIREAFSNYVELLNYDPLKEVIEKYKYQRPPMEAEIGSEVFRFFRNVIIHNPFFKSWDEVWVDKDTANWHREGKSIDKFLRKYHRHKPVKYRIWDPITLKMTYLSINFPTKYTSSHKIFVKDILNERSGVIFSLVLMIEILFTQVESISKVAPTNRQLTWS